MAGGNREGQHVKDQRFVGHAEFVTGDLGDTLGNFELAGGAMRHARLVDGHRHSGSAIARHQRHDFVDFFTTTTFQRHRIYQGSARVTAQGSFEHIGFGGIDDEGQFHVHGQFFNQGDHLLELVAPFGHGHTNIEHVRAIVDLFAGHFEHAVIIIGQQ